MTPDHQPGQEPGPRRSAADLDTEKLLAMGRAAGAGGRASQPGRRGFAPPDRDTIAAAFPELEVRRLLGHGGMGAVYDVVQRRLDRRVALKVMAPELGDDPSFAERFHREARALARLNHPHIVTVFDFGEQGGFFYLLMELVEGMSLRDMLAMGKLTAREALSIVPQICDALQFAHDLGTQVALFLPGDPR